MSCIGDTPVMSMEKLCDEKLECSVCDHARRVRELSGAQPAAAED
ncbi:MAG TPA: hypothetical protein VFD04_07515 [Actinomycetes bacterium]|nr:hypothetical protein [Actinomycetes bacterium]